MGVLSVAREFFERALLAAEAAGNRADVRLIGERLCELAEMADFTEYHVLHGSPSDPPQESAVPTSILRCACGAPTTDTGARGCTRPHGAIAQSPKSCELVMRAEEDRAREREFIIAGRRTLPRHPAVSASRASTRGP